MKEKKGHELRKPFCPVNGKGEIVKKCESVEDLDNFVLWLNLHDEDAKKQKKNAFAVESKKLGMADEALSKCSLVEKVAGGFFNDWLLEINAKALTENELGQVDRPYNEKTSEDLVQARGIFQGLLRSLQEEMFGLVLIKADMEPEAVADLTESLVADSKTLLNLTSILKDRVQNDMEISLESYWASEKSRHDMKREKASGSDEQIEKWGMYAPLVKYMTKRLGPAQAAEFMTRFDLYVRSGWALKDLTTQGKEQSESLSKFNTMFKKLDVDPSTVNEKELVAAVVGRFSELFLPIKVKNQEAGADKPARSAMGSMLVENAFDTHGMAKTGMVDAAIMAADGSRLLLAFATSDEYLSQQKDQWVRHFFGVSNAIKEGVFEDQGIKKGMKIEARVVAPCAFGVEGNFGSVVHKLLFQKPLPSDAVRSMNMAMPLAALINSGATPDEFALFDFVLAGTSVSSWNHSMKQCRAKPNEAGKIGKKEICTWVARQWCDIENFDWVDKVGLSESSLGKGAYQYIQAMLTLSSEAMIWANEDVECAKILTKDKTALVGISRCLSSMRDSKNLSGADRYFFKGVDATFEFFFQKQASLNKKPKRSKTKNQVGVMSDEKVTQKKCTPRQ